MYKHKKNILKLDGWAQLSFQNLIESIEKSKIIALDKFIFSLGIRYVGETLSNLLAKEFVTVDTFINSSKYKEKFYNIDGIGPKAINSIYEYMQNKKNYKIVLVLCKILDITNYKKIKSNSLFSNKSVVFTGTLSKMSREEAKHLAIQLGAKISSSVTIKTDYVIIGKKPGNKKKIAEKLRIPILSEDVWIKKTTS